MEFLPGLELFAIAFVIVTALSVALAVGTVTTLLLRSRPLRLRAGLSIPRYYGALAFGH